MPATNPHFITSPDNLSRRARTLFDFLARDPGRVFTKAAIMQARPSFRSTRDLDSAAIELRAALEAFDGRRSPCNVWGVGYRLEDPS